MKIEGAAGNSRAFLAIRSIWAAPNPTARNSRKRGLENALPRVFALTCPGASDGHAWIDLNAFWRIGLGEALGFRPLLNSPYRRMHRP